MHFQSRNDSLAKDTLEKAARQLAVNLKKYDANAIPAFSRNGNRLPGEGVGEIWFDRPGDEIGKS